MEIVTRKKMIFRAGKFSVSGGKFLTLVAVDLARDSSRLKFGMADFQGECSGGDSNPYGLLHQILSLARLPISPPERRGKPHYS